jgi:peptide/nickel transport system substrate-binding protein
VRIRGLCAAALVVALTISACSSGPQTPPPAGGNAEVGKTNDLNPQDPSTLQDGGALRLALTAFLENFNPLHIDGNMADAGTMLRATMPRAFRIAADGTATVNTDFLNDVELTSTSPQVVTYTINPKAVWSDGTPITWENIKSQIDATDTKNKDFVIAGPNGADRVGSVTRGVDDRQAIMTFAKPYADWKGLFAGNGMLLPKAVTATPEAFNKGFLTNPSPSAGPFVISSIDRTAQRITLTRNPKWSGTPPRLDSITFLVLDDAARISALQNNAIDASGLASLDELTVARRTPGVVIRRAPGH